MGKGQVGPNTDLNTVFAEPLRKIFSKVLYYDVWKNYATIGVGGGLTGRL